MEPPAKQVENSAYAGRSKVCGPACVANGTKVAERPMARFGPLRLSNGQPRYLSVKIRRRVLDPGNPMGRLFYVGVLVLNRCADTARAVANAFPPEVRDTVPARIAFFLSGALAGEGSDAHAAQTEEIERRATAADVFPRMIAQGYALAGVPDRAMHWLAIAVQRGFINYPFLAQYDPCFASLRSLPRFQQLMETVRVRWKRFEA
jgi:hypothetical protein